MELMVKIYLEYFVCAYVIGTTQIVVSITFVTFEN